MNNSTSLPRAPEGDGAAIVPALTFEERMREAELSLRERELAQRIAEWEKSRADIEEDRRLAREKERQENSLPARSGKAFVTFIPLLVAALTVFVGYHQFAQSQQAEAQAQERTATLNAGAEEFKAILAAHQSFLQGRDKAYYDALADAANADAAYNTDPAQFARLGQKFQEANSSELSPVEEDAVESAATLFSFCLYYLAQPTPSSGYPSQMEALWERTHADHPGFPDHLDFANKPQLIDTLEQNLQQIIKASIASEDDPRHYPSIPSLTDSPPHP